MQPLVSSFIWADNSKYESIPTFDDGFNTEPIGNESNLRPPPSLLDLDIEKEHNIRHSVWADLDNACTLTLTERFLGYIICTLAGYVISISSAISWHYSIWDVSSPKFALLYSAGTALSLLANFFLSGPLRQCHLIIESSLKYPAICYVLALCLSIFFAMYRFDSFLILACVFFQFAAHTWFTFAYCISFGCGKFLLACLRFCPCVHSSSPLTKALRAADDDDLTDSIMSSWFV